MSNPHRHDTNAAARERDSATLRILGIFFVIMGGLVLVGTYKALGNVPALLVNIASGLVLVGVGGGMIWVARRLDPKNGSDMVP